MTNLKQRICSSLCVAGAILIFVGVLVLYGSLWGLAVMAFGGLLMAPIWWPALVARLETGNSPFLSAFWNRASRRGR